MSLRAAADAADAPNDAAARRLHAVLSAGVANTDRMYPRLVNAMPTFIPDKKPPASTQPVPATMDKAAVEVELPDDIAGLATAAKAALTTALVAAAQTALKDSTENPLSNLTSSKADIDAALKNIETKYNVARTAALKSSSDGTPPSPGDDVLMMGAIADGKRMRYALIRLTNLFGALQGGKQRAGFQPALNEVSKLIADAAAF